MFRKLRIRLVALTTICASLLVFGFATALNILIYTQSSNNINTVLSVITANDGYLPITKDIEQDLANQNIQRGSLYNFQYFSANKTSSTVSVNLGNTQSLTESKAKELAESAFASSSEYGTVRDNNRYYSYQLTEQKKESLVVFLETTSYYRERNNLLSASFWIVLGSVVFLVLVTSLLSGLMIRPYIRNYEKQRMFITNAGHELKTPLAIISANTELQELMEGETEWSKSTREQTERLSQLIARLIRLSRLEEQDKIETSPQNISPIIEKVAQDMEPLMKQKGLHYERTIQPDLEATVSHDETYELLSILIDNAQKYCDPEGTIRITARQVRYRAFLKRVRIDISNSYEAGENVDYNRFFERFYRAETSHNNQEVSGYGIGLSMAQHLVELFKGRLIVHYRKGMITFSVLL